MDSAEPVNNFQSRCDSLAHGAKAWPTPAAHSFNPVLNNCIQVSHVQWGNAINFPRNPPTRFCDSNPMCTRVMIFKPQLKDISKSNQNILQSCLSPNDRLDLSETNQALFYSSFFYGLSKRHFILEIHLFREKTRKQS